ncbi:TPA: hypothetical protein ACGO2X_002220, partial [Streptococcus suis]
FPSDFDDLPIGITSLSENQESPSSLFYPSSIPYFIPKNLPTVQYKTRTELEHSLFQLISKPFNINVFTDFQNEKFHPIATYFIKISKIGPEKTKVYLILDSRKWLKS